MQTKMAIKKLKLVAIIASAIGIFGLAGCEGIHGGYLFDGKIGEEHVKFWEDDIFGTDNYLEITKPDGTRILYRDVLSDDLKVDFLDITVKGKTDTYKLSRDTDKPVLEEAQRQFDIYLKKILEHKHREAFKTLGGEETKPEKPGVYKE